ncbi:MAG: SDR family NAD(P)-dependent oxidoreductase [Mycobacterium sp.]
MTGIAHDMFRLDGKVAVVTGGGRGIGAMMARGLLQAGATVYLSSRKKTELDAAVAELSADGPVQAIAADLGTIDGVQALAADLADREDAIHALFNNAGAAWGRRSASFPNPVSTKCSTSTSKASSC